MNFIYPDLDWYNDISESKNVSPRCPYANVHKCPRYYSSLYLLGEAGITTKIKPEISKELDEFWEKSNLLPVVAEHDTAITRSGDTTTGYSNFCPEISFDIFGLFATSLHRYADEIDSDQAHAWLENEAQPKDWRWDWAHVEPMHYLKCPVYSQLISQAAHYKSRPKRPPATGDLVEIKPGAFGISLNIKNLLTRLAHWWLSRQGH